MEMINRVAHGLAVRIYGKVKTVSAKFLPKVCFKCLNNKTIISVIT